MKVTNTILMVMALVMVSCGMPPTSEEKAAADKEAADKATAAANAEQFPEGIQFIGYVSPAFDVTVDGKQYLDTEDFYTQQVDKLKQEALDSGYEGWTLDFDAEIGLDDLKAGMKVYIAPTGNRGFAGETEIKYDGSFKMDFPKEAVDAAYKVRAVKRVTVTLTNNADTNQVDRWCYTFNAVDQMVTLSQHDSPVILNNFVTHVTSYKCSTESAGGISISK